MPPSKPTSENTQLVIHAAPSTTPRALASNNAVVYLNVQGLTAVCAEETLRQMADCNFEPGARIVFEGLVASCCAIHVLVNMF